jgi:citrate lyase subunit beta/citryl-CoA lyase
MLEPDRVRDESKGFNMNIRPRRSVLYMPGSNARALEKARTLAVDGVILDLEDAVAPDAKEAARQQVVDAVKAGGFGSREVFVRVNGIDTPWFAEDLRMVAQAAPDAILVPKIASRQQLDSIGTRLLDMHTAHRTRIWAMIETPLALFNVASIAAGAKDSESRLTGFVLGTNDLAKETRARIVPGRAPMVPWLMACVAAAHAYGIDVLDGVYNDLGNQQGFARECAEARDMGFDGKTLIHPSQIEPCNAAFSPTPAEVEEARKIIAAFDLPENRGKGVVKLDGRMVERMHADMARRIVTIANAIAIAQSASV